MDRLAAFLEFDDLAGRARENGDPVANYGHFGGAVLVEDLGWGADR